MLQALSKADNRFSCVVLSNQILYFANITINPTQSPKWIFLRQPVEVLGESLEQLLCHYFVTIRHFITSFETSLISLSQIVYETWSEITEFDSSCKMNWMNWIDMTAFWCILQTLKILKEVKRQSSDTCRWWGFPPECPTWASTWSARAIYT